MPTTITEACVTQCATLCTTALRSVGKSKNLRNSTEEDKEDVLGFQKARRDIKAVYNHSDSESNDNERHKMLYIVFGDSWDITSRHIVKNLRREVAAAAPAPKAAPHHMWMETSISFNASDCPKSMAGVGQLLLLVSPTIINMKTYHILINGGASLNLISLVAFKKLQIPMSKLQPSRPLFGVGPILVIPRDCISLPITFGTTKNLSTSEIRDLSLNIISGNF
jgi:hypothetical protein